eukprot:8467475-Pyramimonas_sp.AAC.1
MAHLPERRGSFPPLALLMYRRPRKVDRSVGSVCRGVLGFLRCRNTIRSASPDRYCTFCTRARTSCACAARAC